VRVLCAQLAGTEFAPALELLRLFAFGTLSDYKGAAARSAHVVVRRCVSPLCAFSGVRRADAAARAAPASPRAAAAPGALPALSPAQLLKLKQLTVASLAEDTKARAPALAHAQP
jgi:hypothetical protein